MEEMSQIEGWQESVSIVSAFLYGTVCLQPPGIPPQSALPEP